MKFNINWIFALFIILLLCSLSTEIVEEFRGKRGTKRRSNNRGRRGHFGRGVLGRGLPRLHRRHNWRRGPNTGIYDGTPYFWGGWRRDVHPNIYNLYPSWLYSGRCGKGCGYVGNGTVGCVNPTNLPDSCIFASDCYGC